MKIKLCAQWQASSFGYVIGRAWVENEAGQMLMNDEDMYYSEEKFWLYIRKTFIKNKRFAWDRPAVYLKKSQLLEVTGADLKER